MLCASYYPLNYWSLVGLEVGLQWLLGLWLACETLAVGATDATAARPALRSPVRFALAATLLLLVRLDGAVALGVSLAWLCWQRRFGTIRRWIAPLAIFSGTLLSYQVFRLICFGDILPNTYYLKMTGVPLVVRVTRGLLIFFSTPSAILLALLVLVAAAVARRHRAPQLMLLMGYVVAAMGYSIYVGGDAWEWSEIAANRFIAPALPFAFIAANGLLIFRDTLNGTTCGC